MTTHRDALVKAAQDAIRKHASVVRSNDYAEDYRGSEWRYEVTGIEAAAKAVVDTVLAATPAEGEWRPIETAEKTGEARLLGSATDGRVCLGFWGYAGVHQPDSEHTWRDGCRWKPFKATHWMPLPTPPAKLAEPS